MNPAPYLDRLASCFGGSEQCESELKTPCYRRDFDVRYGIVSASLSATLADMPGCGRYCSSASTPLGTHKGLLTVT
jgi:hypothetical protein